MLGYYNFKYFIFGDALLLQHDRLRGATFVRQKCLIYNRIHKIVQNYFKGFVNLIHDDDKEPFVSILWICTVWNLMDQFSGSGIGL